MNERREHLIALLDELRKSFADTAYKRDVGQVFPFEFTMEEILALRDAVTEYKQHLKGNNQC